LCSDQRIEPKVVGKVFSYTLRKAHENPKVFMKEPKATREIPRGARFSLGLPFENSTKLVEFFV
jgi:hypothetical protein